METQMSELAKRPVEVPVMINIKRCSDYDAECHEMTDEQISHCANPCPCCSGMEPPDGYCPMLRRN